MDAEDFVIEIEDLLSRHARAVPWMLNLLGSHDTSRVLTLARGDVSRVLLAFTALFTLPGVPMIYYGDEVGLSGGDDPECRRAMPWEPASWDREILDHVHRLSRIRREHSPLRRGSFQRILERNGMAIYGRKHEAAEVVVVLNPRGVQRHVSFAAQGAQWRDLLSHRTYPVIDGEVRVDNLHTSTGLILVNAGESV
ncbi:MAG: alpha-amylase family glycosyl hydrolase [Acidimicrobiia bacterium]